MMGRRGMLGVLGLFAGGLAVLLSGCGSNDRQLRYKVTVEVDTPFGLRTGSSVVETDMDDNGFTFGQAPYVDLGGGRYLFALLNDPFSKKIMYRLAFNVLQYPELQPPLDREKHLYVQAKDMKPFGVVRREDYPMLVTFGDINDPKTVREVDPGIVRRITFQVVDQDEPLTGGLEEKFKWAVDGNLNFNKGSLIRGTADEVPFAQLFNATNFVWRKK